jgi:predicted rRNA methylase YqxC with S4 and FtsJ domains
LLILLLLLLLPLPVLVELHLSEELNLDMGLTSGGFSEAQITAGALQDGS